jgi:hypothetical protein
MSGGTLPKTADVVIGGGMALAELALGTPSTLHIELFACGRFAAIDPFGPIFRAQCAAARSRKREG